MLATKSSFSGRDSRQKSPSISSIPTTIPIVSVTPIPPKEPTPEELKQLAMAITQAREKRDFLLKASMMNIDIAVSDNYHYRDGTITVNVNVILLSEDGVQSFKDGSLRRKVYPTIKGVYIDALNSNGFHYHNVSVSTDVSR